MAKLNFVQRALIATKGTDETVAANIQGSAIKSWENQVKIAKKAKAKLAEDLKEAKEKAAEDIKEANEKLDDSFVTIDLTVKGREARESYVASAYENQIGRAQASIDKLSKDLEDAIELAKKEDEKIDKIIARYEGFIAKIKD